jgi:excisionase family DNA binding protein
MNQSSNKEIESLRERRLLNCEEVASLLNVSRSFVYLIMKRGDVPTVRLGRSVRVRPSDLEQYITMNTNNETNFQ